MKKEYNLLSDEEFKNSCQTINKNVQHLSQTIDDFTNFIKGDRTKKIFTLKNVIDSFLHLVDSQINSHYIKVFLDLQENIQINGYENELIQCLINIFNNAKDALKEKGEDNRFIFISTEINDENIIISIKDNAGGIPKKILPRIFEPYFTTKHRSQGTGLGLHMSYNLIVDGMDGSLEASNEKFEYNGEKYIGAKFVISLKNN